MEVAGRYHFSSFLAAAIVAAVIGYVLHETSLAVTSGIFFALAIMWFYLWIRKGL